MRPAKRPIAAAVKPDREKVERWQTGCHQAGARHLNRRRSPLPPSGVSRAPVPVDRPHPTRANRTPQRRPVCSRLIGCLLHSAPSTSVYASPVIGSIRLGSFFLTLPTSGLTDQQVISPAG